jgi:hypothetical protein
MAKESIPKDVNQNAARIVALSTGQAIPTRVGSAEEKRLRSQAASILGKLGGSKGGKARAANLTAARRKEISQKAAKARWDKESKS